MQLQLNISYIREKNTILPDLCLSCLFVMLWIESLTQGVKAALN